ncbi:hypothetical protein FGSG_13174, partial [Fusarium graminearum PH-1]|uniref:hypothetical protein n=1 Tax=Gibberella zeae (strain ATCC MYA-4620 / CBS 123657 / FGSC 9075 / NRRL 31084 / PH-1) TaxID=229533 RepID=UPI00021F1779
MTTDAPQVSYETPEWVANCRTCKRVWQRLTNGSTFRRPIAVGNYKNPLPAQCPHLQPIRQVFDEYSRDKIEADMAETHITSGVRRYTIDLKNTTSMYSSYTWNLALVDKESVPHHPGTVRILDPEWADLAVLKTWKDTCLSSHGASCQNPFKIWHTRPAWLIDVEQKCLVPGDVGGTYVALSYTYGNHAGRLVDASILDKFQVPGALESPSLSGHISPIIRNAIFLTAAIGEKYLWVDAICITHEDRESTARQLTSMGAIYANAIVTVVAADGDSLTGLAGIRCISAARQLNQVIVPFQDQKLKRLDYWALQMENRLPYYERGWIYQEVRLSTRKMSFT